jgi:hypothetical protein
MTRTSDKRDRYKSITVTYHSRSVKAVQLIRDGDAQWIPWTLLSYSAEDLLEGEGPGTIVDLEIREWKLRELGWL